MRLRQIALVAEDLGPAVDDLCAVLGLEVSFNDPGVAVFGLHNALLPVGDTFLEVVSPTKANTTAGRLLERRSGDGGYMVILQTRDLEADRQRVTQLGVRIVFEVNAPGVQGIHLHPRDVGGAILSLDAPESADDWPYAGPWKSHVRSERVREIVGAELQAEDPAAMAQRWAKVLGRTAEPAATGAHEIAIDGGLLRFASIRDGRGEGVSGITLAATDKDSVLAAARERGRPVDGDALELCGTRIRLV